MITSEWQAARCDNSGPNCVEVKKNQDGGVELRSSEHPDDVLVVTAGEWETLKVAVKDGQFDEAAEPPRTAGGGCCRSARDTPENLVVTIGV